MFSAVLSASVRGIETCFIQVEADVSDGMPIFEMVGYLSSEVREAKERVRTALKNSGIALPPKRITVNLSPANLRKEGAYFDLPIAVAVLASLGIIDSKRIKDVLIVGELSLNGDINPIHGTLSIVSDAERRGIKQCIIPYKNGKEAAIVQNITAIGTSNLEQLVNYFKGNKRIESVHIDIEEIQKTAEKEKTDFSEVFGQSAVKRAAVVAAAGFHNLLLIGPPGTGKTMIAKRIPTILPVMTLEESIEVSKIYSIVGMLLEKQPLIMRRPFRSPHHTTSPQALVGGGRIPKPGEVTLAHKGVLFLDELPEFQKAALEILRQPLEEGMVHIARINGTFHYPAHSMMVAAMNPCKCGYFPDYNRCNCSPREVRNYLNRISRPLLDRIDLCMEAQRVPFEQLSGKGNRESSEQMRKQVEKARAIQIVRYKGMPIQFNSQLTIEGIKQYCILKKEEQNYMETLYSKLDLTARAYHRILKVARTIADLDHSEEIQRQHISEAVCYRSIDKKFWTR